MPPNGHRGMHLDCPLGLPELRPGKYRQAQVNGGCIDRVEGVLEPEPMFRGKIPAPLQKMVTFIAFCCPFKLISRTKF